MNFADIDWVLGEISYKENYRLKWTVKNQMMVIWWEYDRPDAFTGRMETGESGTVIVDPDNLTEEALVRAVFGMTLRLEEHEAREFFRYDDHQPFSPHIALVAERSRLRTHL